MKVWQQQRWELLKPVLESLTLDQEEEIARVCADEIAAWKARPSMKSLSSLKEPMSDMRNAIRALPLTDANTYINPRTQKPEHIALKHLNYSESEWAIMNKQSEDRFHERLENQQLLNHPDRIVAKAVELLVSNQWAEVVVALAVVTGRRLSEIMKVGELHPKTMYTVMFNGQLKRKDEVLRPYEIPTLCEADRVLTAWSKVREMVDMSSVETEAIGKEYGTHVGEAAARHFSDLVPSRDGREKLFAHLLRSVYPRLAVYYFCPPNVSDIAYVSTVLGHYWSTGAAETEQRNYGSSLHYFDYKIGDGNGNIDGRQGVRLGESGVEVLEVFKPRPAAAVAKKKEQQKVGLLEIKKDHSITRMSQETKARIDAVQNEIGSRTQDEALSTIIDEHYVLQQIVALLGDDAKNPVAAVRSLLDAARVNQHLNEQFQTNLDEVIGLLGNASAEDAQPVTYLQGLLSAKRDFKKSYEKRHIGKDYSKMTLTELRRTKTSEAAAERFRRATNAIMLYNDGTDIPELRWFINPAVVADLVGGRPADIKEYLETRREEIDAHHQKYGLTAGYNRRPIPITERVEVPEGGDQLPIETQAE